MFPPYHFTRVIVKSNPVSSLLFATASAERHEHPNHLFLFLQVAGEHIGSHHIIRFLRQFNEFSFFGDEVLVGR